MIRDGQFELVTSFVLIYENSKNRSEEKKASIMQFMKNYSFKHIGSEKLEDVRRISKEIISTGVKQADAAQFISYILSDRFDYTKWRREYFENVTLDEFLDDAAEYEKTHPFTPVKN